MLLALSSASLLLLPSTDEAEATALIADDAVDAIFSTRVDFRRNTRPVLAARGVSGKSDSSCPFPALSAIFLFGVVTVSFTSVAPLMARLAAARA